MAFWYSVKVWPTMSREYLEVRDTYHAPRLTYSLLLVPRTNYRRYVVPCRLICFSMDDASPGVTSGGRSTEERGEEKKRVSSQVEKHVCISCLIVMNLGNMLLCKPFQVTNCSAGMLFHITSSTSRTRTRSQLSLQERHVFKTASNFSVVKRSIQSRYREFRLGSAPCSLRILTSSASLLRYQRPC